MSGNQGEVEKLREQLARPVFSSFLPRRRKRPTSLCESPL